MPKKKIFVSFNVNNDKVLRDFIIKESKNPDSPFEVGGYSLEETGIQKDWFERTVRAITSADVLIIMLGPDTRRAGNVLMELAVADEAGKKKLQIIGYSNGEEDWAVKEGGSVYRWNWENLKKLLSTDTEEISAEGCPAST